MNQQPTPPKNPNRQKSIKAMIVAGLISMFLVVMRIATLGGDSTQTAFGKALVVVPLLILILGSVAAIYYYQDILLSYISTFIPTPTENLSPTDNFSPTDKFSQNANNYSTTNYSASPMAEAEAEQGMLNMLQKVKELQAELDATRASLKSLQDAWNELFGPINVEEVKETLKKIFTELDALRSAESTENMAELQQEMQSQALAIQELTEKLKESQEQVRKTSQHNEELLERSNKATLRIELLESEKARLAQNAKQQTWREIDWEEFMKSVNYGETPLTKNRWGDRIMQRVRKEGLVLFGDPTVTSLASEGDLPELPSK